MGSSPRDPATGFICCRLVALPTASRLKHAIKAQIALLVAAVIVGTSPCYAAAPGGGVTQGGTRYCGGGNPRRFTPVREAETLWLLQALRVRQQGAHGTQT